MGRKQGAPGSSSRTCIFISFCNFQLVALPSSTWSLSLEISSSSSLMQLACCRIRELRLWTRLLLPSSSQKWTIYCTSCRMLTSISLTLSSFSRPSACSSVLDPCLECESLWACSTPCLDSPPEEEFSSESMMMLMCDWIVFILEQMSPSLLVFSLSCSSGTSRIASRIERLSYEKSDEPALFQLCRSVFLPYLRPSNYYSSFWHFQTYSLMIFTYCAHLSQELLTLFGLCSWELVRSLALLCGKAESSMLETRIFMSETSLSLLGTIPVTQEWPLPLSDIFRVLDILRLSILLSSSSWDLVLDRAKPSS